MRTLLNTIAIYSPQKHDDIIWRTSIWKSPTSHQAKASESYAKISQDLFKPSDTPSRLAELPDKWRIVGWSTSCFIAEWTQNSNKIGILSHAIAFWSCSCSRET